MSLYIVLQLSKFINGYWLIWSLCRPQQDIDNIKSIYHDKIKWRIGDTVNSLWSLGLNSHLYISGVFHTIYN